ncbi:hypothetical protein [Arthrobacter sp. B0490]|uniref:hypothetical protein n=1 Tax=Arthrobacter sp. B0490 TaxID=2058891 RepID=UPI0011B0C1AD|nr:hypothetical protein [Arthrobacter sp. B0490]
MESLLVSTLRRILAERGGMVIARGRRPWEVTGNLGSQPVQAVEAIAMELLNALAAEVNHA